MARCTAALRDELRLLPVEQGTLLEATLIGVPPRGADLEDVLLYNVGVPAAQLHAGVRLRRMPARTAGVAQRYRRVPIVAAEPADAGALLARILVPIVDGRESSLRATFGWQRARSRHGHSQPAPRCLLAVSIYA